MRTQVKIYSVEDLQNLLAVENEKFPSTYTDRKKTIIEMLNMRGVRI
jgi:hypothetical protein